MRVRRSCCGLDVHKQTIAACVIRDDADGTSTRQKRIFGTMTQQRIIVPANCDGEVADQAARGGPR